ncbi:hypothetical protein [Leucobacter celer]|nr:hypothetical protein [Leucobacter celer]
MNDFDTYPALMWMLTTALLGVAVLAAAIPLAAALVPTRATEGGEC